jgi:hypothetical protein
MTYTYAMYTCKLKIRYEENICFLTLYLNILITWAHQLCTYMEILLHGYACVAFTRCVHVHDMYICAYIHTYIHGHDRSFQGKVLAGSMEHTHIHKCIYACRFSLAERCWRISWRAKTSFGPWEPIILRCVYVCVFVCAYAHALICAWPLGTATIMFLCMYVNIFVCIYACRHSYLGLRLDRSNIQHMLKW